VRITLLTAALLLALTSTAPAAPALGDKPPKWEYAELSFRNVPGRPALIDNDGNEIPAVPASAQIRWINPAGEVEVKSWDELADKLKAPSLKKGTAAYQKIQILNYLGNEGWELIEQQTLSAALAAAGGFGPAGGRGPGGGGIDRGGFSGPSAASTWLLKRRVP